MPSPSLSLSSLKNKEKKKREGEKNIRNNGIKNRHRWGRTKRKCEGKKKCARILLVEEDIRPFIVRFDGYDQSNSFHSGWIRCKYNRYRIIGKFFFREPSQMRDYCFITGFVHFFRPLFSAMRFGENWGHSWAYRVTKRWILVISRRKSSRLLAFPFFESMLSSCECIFVWVSTVN